MAYGVGLIGLLLASSAQAGDRALSVVDRLAVAYNGLGLNNDLRVESQARLPWTEDGDMLRDGTWWGAGGDVELTPAYGRVGPRISFGPLTVFDISAQARVMGYFGTYGDLQGFPSSTSPYDDETRDARAATEAQPALGFDFDVRPNAQIKLGPVVAAYSGEFHEYLFVTDDPFVYEPYSDLLVGKTDLVLTHDGVVGAFVWDPDGDRQALVAAMLETENAVSTGDSTVQLGPLVVVKPSDRASVPAFIALARYYLQDNLQAEGSFYIAAAVRWSYVRK